MPTPSTLNPFLRTLLPCIATAYGIQLLAALPSIYFQTERFYDLSGSLTYLSVAALSLYLPSIRARAAAEVAGKVKPDWPSLVGALKGQGSSGGLNWRQVVLSAAVGLWAARLGTHLFTRILADGTDSRFEKIRTSPRRFSIAFFAQATWVSLCSLPVLALNALPARAFASLPTLLLTDVLGLALFVGGLAFEVIADRQKARWVEEKKAKVHEELFLTRGLWSKSRHPNYFGESTLWAGIAIAASGVLASKAGVGAIGFGTTGIGLGFGRAVALGVCAVSPAFVTFLLLKVSGVPLSERKYDKRYGADERYRRWKAETPVFVPKLW